MIQTTVGKVCAQSPMRALIVREDTPLVTAIDQFSSNHDHRAIFIINEAEQLVGVVNNHDLLHWARLRLQMPLNEKWISINRARHLVLADFVRDLAVPYSEETAVTFQDSLADALEKMTSRNLADIPVVDENGRIVNDLRLSEILAFAMNPTV